MSTSSSSLSDFNEATLLGEGAYSAVYRVVRKADGKTYALKKVKLPSLSEKEKQNALNEVRLLASVQQPAIISFKEAFFDAASKCLCIVQEYADGGDLYHKIMHQQKQRMYLREHEVWRVFLGMCIGLNVLHSYNVCWRDCKSANVFLFNNGLVKIGDFNVSKVAKRGLLYTQTGTPYYASPEVWKDMPYDAKSDVWSVGCCLHECATLRPPFRADDMEGLYKKVIRGVYPKIPACYSQDLADVIAMLLQVNPTQRPTIAQVLNSAVVMRHLEDAPKYEYPAGSSHLSSSSSFSTSNPPGSLLQTIKLPKNATDIPHYLPPARYFDNDEGRGTSLPPVSSLKTSGDFAAGSSQRTDAPSAIPRAPPRMRHQPQPKPAHGLYQGKAMENEGSTGATSLPSASVAPSAAQSRKRNANEPPVNLVDRYLAGMRLLGAPAGERHAPLSSLVAAQALYGGAGRDLPGRGSLPPAVAQLLGVPSALPALYARQPPRQPRRLPGMPGI